MHSHAMNTLPIARFFDVCIYPLALTAVSWFLQRRPEIPNAFSSPKEATERMIGVQGLRVVVVVVSLAYAAEFACEEKD